MRLKTLLGLTAVILGTLCAVLVSRAQNKASIQMERPGAIHAGGPIAFRVKLNAPLPKGAHFDFRISPVSADEEIPLGSGEPVNGSKTEFRVSGTLPKAAIPGKWHVSVIYLFLPGASWTHTTITPNNLTFEVKGTPYPIPTKAEVSLVR